MILLIILSTPTMLDFQFDDSLIANSWTQLVKFSMLGFLTFDLTIWCMLMLLSLLSCHFWQKICEQLQIVNPIAQVLTFLSLTT